MLPFWIKKVVDFLSKSPFFHFLLPCFYFAPPTFHFLPPCFHFIPPNFLDKPPSFLALLPHFHIVPSSLPYWECNAFVTLAHFVTSSAARIGASTRTRAPTSRTHRVLNSCLHPSPSPLTTWKPEWNVWRFRPFYPSPGEHNPLFIFTFNFLIISILPSSGEEVKVKNGKRRTRAYTRALAIRMWCTFECKMIVLPLYCSRMHWWWYNPQARYRNCRS